MVFLLKKDGGKSSHSSLYYFLYSKSWHGNKNNNIFSIIHIFRPLCIQYRLRVRCMEWQQVRQKTPGKTCGIMARHTQ